MSFAAWLQWLHDTPLSVTMRESTWAEPLVETVHVLTLAVFLGFVVLLDLRLMNLALRRFRVGEILEQLNPGLYAGFTVMIVTGLLLFAGDPIAVYSTVFFKLKMLMLLFAALNIVVFNHTVGRHMSKWDGGETLPLAARLAGVVSLLLWVLIVAAGRAIAYALPPP